MKTVSLIIGILLMVLSGIGFIVCLLLPAMTNNRANFQEAMLGLIPAVMIFIPALVKPAEILWILNEGEKICGKKYL